MEAESKIVKSHFDVVMIARTKYIPKIETTESKPISFISALQKQAFKLRDDIANLKTMKGMLTGFNSSSEYEQISQLMALKEMQVEALRKALTF